MPLRLESALAVHDIWHIKVILEREWPGLRKASQGAGKEEQGNGKKVARARRKWQGKVEEIGNGRGYGKGVGTWISYGVYFADEVWPNAGIGRRS